MTEDARFCRRQVQRSAILPMTGRLDCA